jgi:chorismate mutase
MVRGIRGAITVQKNDEEEMITNTAKLLRQMAEANEIDHEQIAQLIITATDDLNAAFPAKATRSIKGWELVPVMCAREILVPNAMKKCIRVMMTVNTDRAQNDIQHIYLENAIHLRPDISED